MNKDEKFWDQASGNYDKSEQRFEYIHNRTGEKSKTHLKQNHIVLDYGCGTGTKSCELSGLVKEIHAMDISSEMIGIAKNKAATDNIQNINFQQTNIFDNQYHKGSFDVVLAFNMLHTIENPKKVIKRIYELLKNGGLFISATPCLNSRKSLVVTMQIYLVRILSKLGVIPISIRRYQSTQIDELIQNENFQQVESEVLYKGASSYFVVVRKV